MIKTELVLGDGPAYIDAGKCVECGKPNRIVVTPAEVEAYQQWKDGFHAQHVFWHWSPKKRDRIITGLHEECWDTFMGPPLEEPDEQ